jgi:2-oxo-hept-3-ene-1,7-dioate hydratase
MLSQIEIEHVATALDKAEQSRIQMSLISQQFPQATMDDAYAIQAAWVKMKRTSGRKVVGWKIGLTSKAMQYALNISTPDSGVLFDDMVFEDGAAIPQTRFIQPRIEAEIAFVMKHDLRGAKTTAADVLAATDYVSPSLEILDTRILRMDPATKKPRTIVDTISDNATFQPARD